MVKKARKTKRAKKVGEPARITDAMKVEAVIEELRRTKHSVNGGIAALKDTRHKELVASWAGESRGLTDAIKELRKKFPEEK